MPAQDPATGEGTPGFVRALIDAGATLETGAGGWDEALARLPTAPGVLVLESAEGKALLLGTSADMRGFAASRLGAARTARQTDLGSVTARVRAVPVGSGFEADLVYLALARGRMPGDYRKLMARWAVCFVQLDPRQHLPEAEKVELGALVEGAGARPDPEWLLGPVQQKHVGKLIETLVDAFDLCRYPHILRQAPRGVACAYKEMGRCPAPCDGSEPLESYRARCAGAVEVTARPAEERVSELGARMKLAAEAGRFEEAAGIKKIVERTKGLATPALGGVSTLARFRHAVVTRGAKPARARVLFWSGGAPAGTWEGDVVGDGAELERMLGAVPAATWPRSAWELEAFCTLCRWRAGTPASRRTQVVTLGADAPADLAAIQGLVRRTGRKSGAGNGEVEEREAGEVG